MGAPVTAHPSPAVVAATKAVQLERLAAAAWPAEETRHAHGWLLRRTSRVTRRRANSALPPPADRRPERTLDAVEAFYRAAGQPVIVQVSPAEQHAVLDAALAAEGYRQVAPTLVMTAPVAQVLDATIARRTPAVTIANEATVILADQATVTLASEATGAWRRGFEALDAHSDSAAVGERVLARIPAPAAYASIDLDGNVVGSGMFVATAEWTGVFGMVVHPRHRRQGLALALLHAGARWAARHGTGHLYLQVERDNEPARLLYGRVGFTRSHGYHYRIADSDPVQPLPRADGRPRWHR